MLYQKQLNACVLVSFQNLILKNKLWLRREPLICSNIGKLSLTGMTDKFKVGDFVWAKMKGYPAWPAEVVNHPSGRTKAKQHYVIFFGSKQFAWIADHHIFPYVENIENLSKKSRHRGYQEAIMGIEKAYKEYLLQNEKPGTSGTNNQKAVSESTQNEQSSTSGTNDEDEILSIQGNEYVIRKNRKRTPEEMEERRRLINKRLRVKLLLPKNKKIKKVAKKKQSSNKDSLITVKVEDYKQIITKEAMILLHRCDTQM